MAAHYFVGNRLLGSTSVPQTWDGVQPFSSNLAQFCPFCGDLWGRIAQDHLKEWSVTRAACEKCPPTWAINIPGSFLRSWNPHNLSELPDAVLEREFFLHLKHRERNP